MIGDDPTNVLIAEDEDVVREALADLIETEDSLNVVGTARDADEAIELARMHRPDIAIVDVKMPAGGGPRATREIREISPQTRVLVVSAYEDRRTVLEMLRAGAAGYLVKGASMEQILDAIHRCVRGQSALSVEVTGDVIDELVQLLERSERMAGELQELDRMKSDLIQILSHELFTPITTIQGFASTVQAWSGNLSPDDVERMAEGVGRASTQLRRLVGNIAAAARLDRRGVEIATRPMLPGEIISGAVAEFGPATTRIDVASEEFAGIQVWADAELAVRALAVVVENALDLSPEDERVEIQVRPRGEFVEIRVLDRGPGVPPDVRDRIFGAFSQADAGLTRAHGGLGIGLYLAKRIMLAHRGHVDVLARPGGGSTFVLSFPAFAEGVGSSY